MIRKWTTSETEFLLKYRQNYSLSSMAFKLKRSETAIINKVNSLGHTWRRKHHRLPHRYWSLEEKQFLTKNYGKIPVNKLAKELNRTPKSIWSMVAILSLWKQTAAERLIPPKFFLTDTETAYIAGIIDGEGCFSVDFYRKRRSPTIQLSLNISNTNLELIQWLKNKFNLKRNYKSHFPGTSFLTLHVATVSQRAHLKQIIQLVLPYLIVKKKAANHFLDIIELQNQRISKLRILKKILEFKESLNTSDRRRKNSIEHLKIRINNLQSNTWKPNPSIRIPYQKSSTSHIAQLSLSKVRTVSRA